MDRALATCQWQALLDTYRQLGHDVAVIEPAAGLPDMVFAADGGLVIAGSALGARFRFPHRQGEAGHHLAWFTAAGLDHVTLPRHINEGEGDLLVVGDRVLAGTGYRTDAAAHQEVQEHFGRQVVSLQLIDPRYCHLNTTGRRWRALHECSQVRPRGRGRPTAGVSRSTSGGRQDGRSFSRGVFKIGLRTPRLTAGRWSYLQVL